MEFKVRNIDKVVHYNKRENGYRYRCIFVGIVGTLKIAQVRNDGLDQVTYGGRSVQIQEICRKQHRPDLALTLEWEM